MAQSNQRGEQNADDKENEQTQREEENAENMVRLPFM